MAAPVEMTAHEQMEKTTASTPRLVCALDESGRIICRYDQDKGEAQVSIHPLHSRARLHIPCVYLRGTDCWCTQPPKTSLSGYAKALLDVFLPAGYPHTVTPDYTPYQVYVSYLLPRFLPRGRTPPS